MSTNKNTSELLNDILITVGGVLRTLISYALRQLLLFAVTLTLLSVLSYTASPALFKWVLVKAKIPIDGLSLSEELLQAKTDLRKIIADASELREELRNQKDTFEAEKRSMLTKIGQLDGEKKGVIEGIRSMTFEKVNWWNVILTTAGITVIGGCAAYFLLGGSDGDFFKQVIDLINSSSKKVVDGTTQSLGVVNNNLVTQGKSLEDLDGKVTALQNTVSIISERVSRLCNSFEAPALPEVPKKKK